MLKQLQVAWLKVGFFGVDIEAGRARHPHKDVETFGAKSVQTWGPLASFYGHLNEGGSQHASLGRKCREETCSIKCYIRIYI